MTAAPSPGAWRPLELVAWTADYFRAHGVPAPRLDAELLLAHALGMRRIDLYLDFDRPVGGSERGRFRELVRERARERVPVAYLTGEREFWSRPFRVTRDVLIPRPETETLVRVVCELAPQRVAEVGVGSGAVAASLALELPEARLVAVDCSRAALAVARDNLERLGVADRVGLLLGAGVDALSGRFDALVSNPPYVPTRELAALPAEVRHEPRVALDGGADGLAVVRELVRCAPRLVPGGHLVLELGPGQAAPARVLLERAGARRVTLHRDLAGIDRVIAARFEAPGSGADGGRGRGE